MFAASLSCYKTYWHFLVRKNLLHPPCIPDGKVMGRLQHIVCRRTRLSPDDGKRQQTLLPVLPAIIMGKTNRCGCPNPLKNQHIHHDE